LKPLRNSSTLVKKQEEEEKEMPVKFGIAAFWKIIMMCRLSS
jgi:hypothetical protein